MLSEQDYLSVVQREAAATVSDGQPTECLIAETVASIPGMVMQKFHNLRGHDNGVPHCFHLVEDRAANRIVRLTPQLQALANDPTTPLLMGVLEARWNIVETAFDTGLAQGLL